MKMYDPVTNFFLGDPESSPFPDPFPPFEAVGQTLSGFILSASGWRKVFAADGSEESRNPGITPEDTVLVAAIGKVFAEFLSAHVRGQTVTAESSGRKLTLALGMDTRETGPAIGDVLVRVFLSLGLTVRYLFISAAPEIMAHTRLDPGIDGFVYISASHNPVGHNGIKFGLGDGAVLGGEGSSRLIDEFTAIGGNRSALREICACAEAVPPEDIAFVFRQAAEEKKAALESYSRFTREVITGFPAEGPGAGQQDRILQKIRKSCRKEPIGIVGELNGSARTRSIDCSFFEDLEVGVEIINGEPRQIAHPIVPEGHSLDLCKTELERLYREHESFLLGYVPDNDGDRGNIVFMDPDTRRARAPKSQEVFALAVAGELSYIAWSGLAPVGGDGKFTKPVAAAVNGPTSMRIERIADAFGAKVFRAEVGEANVVSLAKQLREQGYIVRILGEGSNGGNITYPSSVRDPLSTLCALLKMLRLIAPPEGCNTGFNRGAAGVLDRWLTISGQCLKNGAPPAVQGILSTLPVFTTTASYEPEAIMKIKTTDHALLKRRYEEVFVRQWDKERKRLGEMLGIASWEEVNYEGTEERRGFGPDFRKGKEKGGLKMEFRNGSGEPVAFIWMRGSGTEPVFRVLADVEGDNKEAHDYLLAWHRKMIEAADLR